MSPLPKILGFTVSPPSSLDGKNNKKNKSDNTLHCSLLFPKNGLLHDHQLVVGQVACQKGLALGVTDMTRKNRREIGPLTIETY